MEIKFAVALLRGDDEQILGIFNTREEADKYGYSNVIDPCHGLQYCFSSLFSGTTPTGDSMRIYDYYNMQSDIGFHTLSA